MAFCFLKMPVNLAQYRMTVGIYTNRKIILRLHYEGSLYSGMPNNLSNYASCYASLIFYFCFYVLFLSRGTVLKITTKFCVPSFLFHNIAACGLVCLCSLLLMLSGDVEINSGPLSNCKDYFSVCHWNLNRISVHDYSKLFLLKQILYFINLISFIRKISWFLILLLSPMMTNYKFLSTIPLIQNAVESVYITEVIYR